MLAANVLAVGCWCGFFMQATVVSGGSVDRLAEHGFMGYSALAAAPAKSCIRQMPAWRQPLPNPNASACGWPRPRRKVAACRSHWRVKRARSIAAVDCAGDGWGHCFAACRCCAFHRAVGSGQGRWMLTQRSLLACWPWRRAMWLRRNAPYLCQLPGGWAVGAGFALVLIRWGTGGWFATTGVGWSALCAVIVLASAWLMPRLWVCRNHGRCAGGRAAVSADAGLDGGRAVGACSADVVAAAALLAERGPGPAAPARLCRCVSLLGVAAVRPEHGRLGRLVAARGPAGAGCGRAGLWLWGDVVLCAGLGVLLVLASGWVLTRRWSGQQTNAERWMPLLAMACAALALSTWFSPMIALVSVVAAMAAATPAGACWWSAHWRGLWAAVGFYYSSAWTLAAKGLGLALLGAALAPGAAGAAPAWRAGRGGGPRGRQPQRRAVDIAGWGRALGLTNADVWSQGNGDCPGPAHSGAAGTGRPALADAGRLHAIAFCQLARHFGMLKKSDAYRLSRRHHRGGPAERARRGRAAASDGAG
ncbi:hypothetical protein FQR65_LT20438 [Abscondita terminalis]|nr:hypothetical protein FQR65_LT20438 [Abscondita terminalis]